MKNILYSENLKKFSQKFKQKVNSVDDCYEKLSSSISLIAKDINIGRFDIP